MTNYLQEHTQTLVPHTLNQILRHLCYMKWNVWLTWLRRKCVTNVFPKVQSKHSSCTYKEMLLLSLASKTICLTNLWSAWKGKIFDPNGCIWPQKNHLIRESILKWSLKNASTWPTLFWQADAELCLRPFKIECVFCIRKFWKLNARARKHNTNPRNLHEPLQSKVTWFHKNR